VVRSKNPNSTIENHQLKIENIFTATAPKPK